MTLLGFCGRQRDAHIKLYARNVKKNENGRNGRYFDNAVIDSPKAFLYDTANDNTSIHFYTYFPRNLCCKTWPENVSPGLLHANIIRTESDHGGIYWA